MNRFKIDTQEELGLGLERIIKEQLNDMMAQTMVPVSLDSSIQRIRKNCTRYRSVLHTIRWDIKPADYERENAKYKQITHQLAKIRNLHLIIAYLNDCYEAKEIGISKEQYDLFNAYLNDIKNNEVAELEHKQALKNIKEQAEHTILDLDIALNHTFGPATIKKGVFHVYRKCVESIERSQKKLTNHTLHTLRTQIKYLMYQMQLCEETWPSYFKTYCSSLKEVSDLLRHDDQLVTLQKLIKQTPEDVLNESSKKTLYKSLKNERNQLHSDIWPLMARLFAEEPDAFIKRINSYWLIGREN